MSEYKKELAQFVAEEKRQSEKKPSGFFGEWAFYVMAKRTFDRKKKQDVRPRNESGEK